MAKLAFQVIIRDRASTGATGILQFAQMWQLAQIVKFAAALKARRQLDAGRGPLPTGS